MSKKKKFQTEREKLYEQNIATIQIFEKPQNEPKRYIRLSHYLLQHKNYINLSSKSKVVYSYMLDWAFGSEEYLYHKTFDYSTTMLVRAKVMTNKTIIEAFKELEYYGFIKKENNATRDSGITQKWSFSDDWYSAERKPMP